MEEDKKFVCDRVEKIVPNDIVGYYLFFVAQNRSLWYDYYVILIYLFIHMPFDTARVHAWR